MDDLISRSAVLDALDEQIEQCNKSLSSFDISMKDEYAVKVERASLVAFREILEYLPPAQLGTNLAEAGTDCISRQAAITALTFAKETGTMKCGELKGVIEVLNRLPSAGPTFDARDTQYNLPIGTDYISRQAAIDAYGEWYVEEGTENGFIGTVKQLLEGLPPAQHERTPMQELLDVTADRDYWKAQCHSYEMTINRLIESAQPEIIRCKDCDYGVVDDPQIPFLRFCTYSGQDWNDENHYCGHAKRRNNAELD